MAHAEAVRREGFTHDVSVGGHQFVVDEPVDVGGNDEGPTPTGLLAASLASCTAITVEMYADRKEWTLRSFKVTVDEIVDRKTRTRSYDVCLHLPGGLSEERTQKLITIASKCPVHKALAGENTVSIHNRAVVCDD